MMDPKRIKELADYVHTAEKEAYEIKKITDDLYPKLTVDQAYLVQEEVVHQKLEAGCKIVGPKMGLTSAAKMSQMNVDDPIYGFIFDYMVVEDGDSISMKDYIHPKVEPEIGFVLNRDLEGPNVTAYDVMQATEYIFPAIEIIDSRYENFHFTLPDVIADNTSARGVVFGTRLCKPDLFELDVLGVTLLINGEIRAMGTGAAVLGHPANSIARLAQMLHKKGKKVLKRQPILTGGVTEAVLVAPQNFVQVKIAGLGDVSFYVDK